MRLIGFAEVRGSRGLHPFYPEHTLKMGAIAVGLLVFIVDLVMIFPPTLGLPANPQEVASDVSPPWYFSAAYMWITLLPGRLPCGAFWAAPDCLWSIRSWTGSSPSEDGRCR